MGLTKLLGIVKIKEIIFGEENLFISNTGLQSLIPVQTAA